MLSPETQALIPDWKQRMNTNLRAERILKRFAERYPHHGGHLAKAAEMVLAAPVISDDEDVALLICICKQVLARRGLRLIEGGAAASAMNNQLPPLRPRRK